MQCDYWKRSFTSIAAFCQFVVFKQFVLWKTSRSRTRTSECRSADNQLYKSRISRQTQTCPLSGYVCKLCNLSGRECSCNRTRCRRIMHQQPLLPDSVAVVAVDLEIVDRLLAAVEFDPRRRFREAPLLQNSEADDFTKRSFSTLAVRPSAERSIAPGRFTPR